MPRLVFCPEGTLEISRWQAKRSHRMATTTKPAPEGRRNLSLITYHVSRITYHVSRITYHVSRITHHASRITHHASRITHHASRITHHASRITHHVSRITHHVFYASLQRLDRLRSRDEPGAVNLLQPKPHFLDAKILAVAVVHARGAGDLGGLLVRAHPGNGVHELHV